MARSLNVSPPPAQRKTERRPPQCGSGSPRQSGGKARTQHDLNGFSYPLPLLGDVYNLFVVRCSETFLLELTRRVDP